MVWTRTAGVFTTARRFRRFGDHEPRVRASRPAISSGVGSGCRTPPPLARLLGSPKAEARRLTVAAEHPITMLISAIVACPHMRRKISSST
jgi:hypothetical protein